VDYGNYKVATYIERKEKNKNKKKNKENDRQESEKNHYQVIHL